VDILSKVAVAIARQVVPDEIHQAQLIAKNFAKGGKSRKELLLPVKGGELGGFGVDEASLLAWVFHALAEAAPLLTGFLLSKTLENANLIIREIRSALATRESSHQSQVRSSQQQEADITSSPLPPSQFLTAPKQLQQCVVAVSNALQKAGLSSQESEIVAYKTINALWEDAPDALVFLRKITERK